MSWEGLRRWGEKGLPCQQRAEEEEGKEKQLLIHDVEGPTTAPAVLLGKHPAAPQGPAALASCTSTRRHVAPEQDAPHAAARASASPLLPGSRATGRLLAEQLNAGWPTSPSAS